MEVVKARKQTSESAYSVCICVFLGFFSHLAPAESCQSASDAGKDLNTIRTTLYIYIYIV